MAKKENEVVEKENEVVEKENEVVENAKTTAEKIIEDATKMVEKMLADAEKKVSEKLSMTSNTTPTNAREKVIRRNKKTTEQEEKIKAYMEQKVPFYAMKDNDKYKDDIFVSVNGDNCLIKRGEQVQIKRKFFEVLKNSDRQDMKTYEMMETFNKKF